MKTNFLPLLLILLVSSAATLRAQTIAYKQLWETDTTLRTPESVLYDPEQKILYVSCINGGPALENKNSYIATVGLDGKIIKPRITENLNSTKGLGKLGNKLYVTEMTNVVEIELPSGKILNRYAIPEAKFLNDIAVDAKKKVLYITDMRNNRIWTLDNGKANMLLDGAPLNNPNGLLFDNNLLLIGNGDGSLLAVDPTTKQVKTLAKVSGGIDGIAALGNQAYIVSEWAGKVWHVKPDGTTELKSDTVQEKINAADIDYNANDQVLYIPTFWHNKVNAYSLK